MKKCQCGKIIKDEAFNFCSNECYKNSLTFKEKIDSIISSIFNYEQLDNAVKNEVVDEIMVLIEQRNATISWVEFIVMKLNQLINSKLK